MLGTDCVVGQILNKKSHESTTKKRQRAGKTAPVTDISASLETTVLPTPQEPLLLAQPPRHWVWEVLLVALPVLIAATVLMVWLAGNHYYIRYAIGQTVVSAHTSDAVLEHAVTRTAGNYRLHVVDPHGKSQSFSLKEVGLEVNETATVHSLRLQQRSWRSRLHWWQPVQTKLVTQVDAAVLHAFIAQHITKVIQPAQDAALSLVDGEVKASEASMGRQYGLDHAPATVLGQANRLDTRPLRVHIVALPPAIGQQALATAQARLEAILHQPLKITVAGRVITPTTKEVADWLSLRPEPGNKTVDMQPNSDHIQAYLAQLATQHTRLPHAQLSNGSTSIPGEYGVKVTGTADVAAIITNQLLAAKGVQVDVPTVRTPFKTVSAPLAGKWIEVDLTTKRMYAYQQTTVAHSFLVLAGAPATPTVTGRFAIYSKFTSQNMYGTGADGAAYFQPHVPWVNYFYRDYAIHGNYWRPASYFGNVNASHGCVGISSSEAAWIYTWAPIGTPVIVHT